MIPCRGPEVKVPKLLGTSNTPPKHPNKRCATPSPQASRGEGIPRRIKVEALDPYIRSKATSPRPEFPFPFPTSRIYSNLDYEEYGHNDLLSDFETIGRYYRVSVSDHPQLPQFRASPRKLRSNPHIIFRFKSRHR